MRKAQLAKVPAGSGLKPMYGSRLPGIVEQILIMVDQEKVTRRRLEQFGDISYSKFLGRKIVSVMSASGAQTVATNRNKAFANEPAWDFLIGVAFRRGVLLMDFDEHRHHRAILQQAFTSTNLKGYLQEMQPVISEKIARLPTGTLRMAEVFKAITLDMALEVFLGVELPRDEADKINKAFIHCLEGLAALVRHPIPGGRWRRAINGRKVLEEFFYQQLPAKRAKETPDLFSVLCHAESDEGHMFTDEDVVNHMIFVLFAAHDTSTTAMTTMAYYLARYPQWQQRLREQSMSFDDYLSYDTLDQLTELDLLMKESLRLNPPVPTLAREALVDTEIDGYYIPKGTFVAVSPPAIHHNPAIWRNPYWFDPERFSPGRREDKAHRFAWIPFGAGVHKCIGMSFAQLEIKTVMHNLLRTYEWSVPADYRWKLDPTTLGMPKDGLVVDLRRR